MKRCDADKRVNLTVVSLVILISFFTFLLFCALASSVVALLFYLTAPGPESALIPSFIAKAVLCALLALLTFVAVVRTGIDVTVDPESKATFRPAPILIVLLLASAFVFPRLDTYPWAAPDEVHHLTVARNLALHGTYASGHPDSQLREFDTYDSVGPPVILPIALSFRTFGVHLYAARAVIAVYFLVLCVALYALLLPLMRAPQAALAISLMTFSFGSVYLGRTLYGEVPALAWLALGLLAWRGALRRTHGLLWGLAAGAAFGLAILCKSILVLSAFAFLAALLYDRITFRRIRLPHIIAPAVGLVLVIAGWWAVQAFSRHDVAGAAGGTLGIYKHNLMLGLRSAPRALLGLLLHSMQTLPLILCMLLVAQGPFRKQYSPPVVVLYFIAVFYAAWWVFFTPATMPRYLWFSSAIAVMATTPALWAAPGYVKALSTSQASRFSTILLLIVAAAAAFTPASRLVHDVRAVYTVDEMSEDYAISDWVAALPPHTAVAATWPLSGSLSMFANRPAAVLDHVPNPLPPNQVLIIDTIKWPRMLDGLDPAMRFGRYAVVMAKE